MKLSVGKFKGTAAASVTEAKAWESTRDDESFAPLNMAGEKDGGTAGSSLPFVNAVRLAWTSTSQGEVTGEKPAKVGEDLKSGRRWSNAAEKVKLVGLVGKLSKEASKKKYVRQLIKRAQGGSEKRPATKASRMLRFSPTNMYFLILEKEWWFCLLTAAVAYIVPTLLFGLLSLPLELDNGTEDVEFELHGYSPPKAIVAFRFSSANVIGMGYGTVVPTSNVGFFIAIVSQVTGILVNVFVFAAVLAKFQSPKADVVFSSKVCFFTRNSVRHVCIRLGNLRCHTLFNPSLRLFLLKSNETSEGEQFVKIQELAVDEPGTVSGVYNITHKIDEESPLFELKGSDLKSKESVMALQCIFTALDPVYQAEVCAKVSYTADQLVFGARFSDMFAEGQRGSPTLDFSFFEQLEEVPEYWEEESNLELDMSNSEAPPKRSRKVCLVNGYGRSSYADKTLDGDLPLAGMRSICAYALSVSLVLHEAGIDFDEYRADLGDKPEWHKDVNPKLETPACRLADSEEWLDGGSDYIIDRLIETYSEFKAVSMWTPNERIKEHKKEYYEPHMVCIALCLSHAKPDNQMRSFLLKKFDVDPEMPADECKAALRVKVREHLARWEEALGTDETPFLCGENPGILDCQVVPKLFTAFQLAESQLADVGAPFIELAPLSFAYLDRFSKRESWLKAFGRGRGVGGKLDVATIRGISEKLNSLTPELCDSVIIPALENARRAKMVKGDAKKNTKKARRMTTATLCL